jgi:hypothetical protein
MYEASTPDAARFGLLAPVLLSIDAWLVLAAVVRALL